MNIPDYIASGILESYALSTVSDQERREVECLSAIYPEIRQELDRLTLALENYALMHSVTPPTNLQDKIRQRLVFEPTNPPEVEETPVVPLHRERPVYQGAWLAAASVGLALLVFTYFLINQLQQKRALSDELAQSNRQLEVDISQLRVRQQRSEELLALVRQPGLQTVKLAAATPGGQKADVLVYWNRISQQVTLEITQLPPLPVNRQYQLWALVGGKPVDAGVLNVPGDASALQRTNRLIQQADAFAITVERTGGSPTPTLTSLVALGKV